MAPSGTGLPYPRMYTPANGDNDEKDNIDKGSGRHEHTLVAKRRQRGTYFSGVARRGPTEGGVLQHHTLRELARGRE